MSDFVPFAATAGGFALAVLLCLCFARPRRSVWLGMSCAYLLADVAATILPPSLPGVHGNWTGKLASLTLAIVVAKALAIDRAELCFALPQTQRQWSWAVLGAIVAIGLASTLSFLFRSHAPVFSDRLAYEALLPGVAEEFAYRGVAFALLMRAYRGSMHAELAAATCLTLVFALGHGISMDHGVLSYSIVSPLYAAAFSGWLFLIRQKSCSVPILAGIHNLANIGAIIANALP